MAVDGSFAILQTYVEDALHGDWMRMFRIYYENLSSMLCKDRPQIIGHFDLVRKQPQLAGFFTSPAYRRIALNALERSRACGGVLEINTGGMVKGKMSDPHPSGELMGAWLEMGGAVTVTSDCHDAAFLNFGLDRLLVTLKRIGYRSVQRLGAGDALWETIELP